MKQLLLLALAGMAGTLARYGVYAGVQRTPWGGLPLATLVVNVAGSFAFGVVWPLAEQGRMSAQTRLTILAGFMGAFTTFSTFAFESGQMVRESNWAGAAANIAANNVLGIGAFLVGMAVAQRV